VVGFSAAEVLHSESEVERRLKAVGEELDGDASWVRLWYELN
jgi:hypothetical protein